MMKDNSKKAMGVLSGIDSIEEDQEEMAVANGRVDNCYDEDAQCYALQQMSQMERLLSFLGELVGESATPCSNNVA